MVCGAAERLVLGALAARFVRVAERLDLGAVVGAADDARARARREAQRRVGARSAGSCCHAGRGRAAKQRSHGAGRGKRIGIGQWGRIPGEEGGDRLGGHALHRRASQQPRRRPEWCVRRVSSCVVTCILALQCISVHGCDTGSLTRWHTHT